MMLDEHTGRIFLIERVDFLLVECVVVIPLVHQKHHLSNVEHYGLVDTFHENVFQESEMFVLERRFLLLVRCILPAINLLRH